MLTVGAFTEKTAITDPVFNGWGVMAQVGDLMPRSRTSVTWNYDWPLKPDVVFEGGNLGVDPATLIGDHLDDLALLTTYRTPENRAFTTTGETSAATALAARMGAQILGQRLICGRDGQSADRPFGRMDTDDESPSWRDQQECLDAALRFRGSITGARPWKSR